MIAEAKTIEHVYAPRGAADELCDCTDPEVLLDGPAGTGKSRAWLEVMVRDAAMYANSRQAIVRKTRVSLTDSALVTLETKVLCDGMDEYYLEQSLAAGPTRATRHIYRFRNGSEIACHGMDNPTRLFSTEYDRIYVQEATELTENEWESLHRALRNNVMPFQQLGGDCNPDAEFHWLNQRCNAGKTRRLLSRHRDNPSLTPEYLERLSNLTGVRRKRLFLGQWVSAEGQIWANFDPYTHVIDSLPCEMAWYFCSVDWGYRNPGVLQVWGVDKERRMYLIREIYETQRNPEWWAEKAAAIQKQYDPRVFVCDPADPANIDLFNHRLYQRGDRNCAIEAMNSFEAGANIVRDRLATSTDGKPRLFILRNALESRDPELAEAKKPCGLIEEIPSYTYREIKDGQPVREEPAPDSDDHSCDAARYACAYLDYSVYEPQKPVKVVDPNTFEGRFNVEEFMERLRSKR